jgi:hypothetical protein
MGLSPYTDSTNTTLSDPKSLIEAALKASDKKGKGADLNKLATLFPSAMAMRAVKGFAGVYNEAGGGAKGMQAVEAEFQRLQKAQLDAQEVQRAFNASMNTSEAKVKAFNNQMTGVAEQMAGVLLPALEGLAPSIVAVTKEVGDWVSEMTGQKHQDAVDNAASGMGTLSKDAGLVMSTATTKASGFSGGQITTYSAEAVENLKHDQARRQAAMRSLRTDIYSQEDEAEQQKKMGSGVTGAASGWIEKKLGLGTNTEKGEQLAAQAAEERKTLEKMEQQEQETQNILRMIHTAIKEGNAVVKSTATKPPKADTSGQADPNADTE